MTPIIRSDGNPKFAMFATIAGAVTNIILDPIFIFPFKMGMMGAAVGAVAFLIVEGFRIYLYMMILATVNKGTFIYLQALEKTVESTLISLTREIIFGVFLTILLPIFFGLNGLLYSFPAADILTFILAVFIIQRT